MPNKRSQKKKQNPAPVVAANSAMTAYNIPRVICNPKRIYRLMMTEQLIEQPPKPFSGSITYQQLMAALVKQISEHKNPELNIPPATQWLLWRNLKFLKAAAWGVPFVGTAQNQGVKFSLILVKDAQAAPSVEYFDQAAGMSDRPFATVRGGPLNWSVASEGARTVLTMTDVDTLIVDVQVW
jgi:hypothetical protein